MEEDFTDGPDDEALFHRDNGAGSDADSDLEELEGDMAKFDESVRQFLSSHHGGAEGLIGSTPASGSRGGPSRRGHRTARGPRKAAKPRGDITARLAKVNQAFLAGDYATALDLASEVVRINAETHQAWTTLSSIFAEIGEVSKALSAMVYAAHLRPKNVEGWLNCASYATAHLGEDQDGNLHTARLCYSAALRADGTNLQARLGKATICHQQGHLGSAIADYKYYLNRCPHDLDIVRKLAEACVDNRHTETAIPTAIEAYRRYFDIEVSQGPSQPFDIIWHDIGIYVELFASVGRYAEAIRELKSLARWVVGRHQESFWDDTQETDCEWDGDHERRMGVPDFAETAMLPSASQSIYGSSLPLDLRARLAIYRLGLGDIAESLQHLSWLEPQEPHTRDFVLEFPFLIFDVASELLSHGHHELAAKYLEMLRDSSEQPDPNIYLQLGRCFLAAGDNASAEECFLGAIDIDEDCIEPRIELANMYEQAREDEEALILAAEAMALQESTGQPMEGISGGRTVRRPQGPRRMRPQGVRKTGKPAATRDRRTVLPRRYRPKRLVNPDKRRQEEQTHAIRLSRQYQTVCDLRQQIRSGRQDLVDAWMQSSSELIDDFRSLKKFYSWEKYLRFLGPKSGLQAPATGPAESELGQMYERLTRIANQAPQNDTWDRHHERPLESTHQGISFDQWLGLFIDYAIGLAMADRREEAYQVCAAARDSNAFQSADHHFAIHVAWSVCAIYTCDEERCTMVARHLMKDGLTSDSSRMFALLSCLCQSPISWYTSGPTQKYILRQIKAIDSSQAAAVLGEGERTEALNAVSASDVEFDVCLLMLYGHILFSSTSYTYALTYFLRAFALDPQNPMINLSLGLAYVHHGMKRQSANRQYLILQGQAFIWQYAEQAVNPDDPSSSNEIYYNIGRLFHLLGMTSMALKYYSIVTDQRGTSSKDTDIYLLSKANQAISLLSVSNKSKALRVIKDSLVL